MDYRLQQFMKKYMPKGKDSFSRDAVELLMGLLWEEAVKSEKSDRTLEENRQNGREIIGPYEIE